MATVRALKLFIASPSDVTDARRAAGEVVSELNDIWLSRDRMIRVLCEPREMPRPVYGAELIGVGFDD